MNLKEPLRQFLQLYAGHPAISRMTPVESGPCQERFESSGGGQSSLHTGGTVTAAVKHACMLPPFGRKVPAGSLGMVVKAYFYVFCSSPINMYSR
jgi:hypothetical protein